MVHRRSGFVLGELAALAAVLAAVVAVLMVVGGRQRRSATLDQDLYKFNQIGVLTGLYASDNQDKFWGFSWKKGLNPSPFPDWQYAATDWGAHVCQLITVMRLRGGRPDFTAYQYGLIAFVRYSHIPLLDYAGLSFPNTLFVSSGDRNRLLWASDPACFDRGCFGKLQPPPGGDNMRWPYSASFEHSPIFFDVAPAGARLAQQSVHSSWLTPPNSILRQRHTYDFAFPARKVFLHDTQAWFFSNQPKFFMTEEAVLPVMFVDGHVSVKATRDSDVGWQPNDPESGRPTELYYAPQAWDPPIGKPMEEVVAHYRFTRIRPSAARPLDAADFSTP